MNKRESQEKVMIKRTNAPERKKTAGTLKGLNDELREASIIRYWTGETQGFIFSRLLRCAVTGAEKVKDGKARKGKWQEQKKNLTKNTRQKDKKPITEFKQWIFSREERGKADEREEHGSSVISNSQNSLPLRFFSRRSVSLILKLMEQGWVVVSLTS